MHEEGELEEKKNNAIKEESALMSEKVYNRLSSKGKRRAVIAEGISAIFYAAVFTAVGYAACFIVHGIQMLWGVA